MEGEDPPTETGLRGFGKSAAGGGPGEDRHGADKAPRRTDLGRTGHGDQARGGQARGGEALDGTVKAQPPECCPSRSLLLLLPWGLQVPDLTPHACV